MSAQPSGTEVAFQSATLLTPGYHHALVQRNHLVTCAKYRQPQTRANLTPPRRNCKNSPGEGGKRFKESRHGLGALGSVAIGASAWLLGPSNADAANVVPLPLDDKGKSVTPVKDTGRKRVLVLMSDTGGGHRASAEALQSAFEERYGNKYEVFIVDIWKKHTRWPISVWGDSYNFMVKYPWIWRINYRFSEPRFINEPFLAACAAYCKRDMALAFDKYKPHLIVSVHPLMQDVPLSALALRVNAGLLPPTPFATVVTDLTSCHTTWFNKKVTRCFVPTEDVVRQAKAKGLKDEQITCHGLPIRPAFAAKLPPKASLRKKLGLLVNAPTVLVTGGGDGMGKLESTTYALAKTLGKDAQVVVICGRNTKLADKLKAEKWPFKVVVNGFVTNMSEWMAASDCIITKAGPGTIAEALIRGVPLLLNGCIPCQEEDNIPYVVNNNVGTFESKPKKIAKIVSDWFGPKRDELEAMAARAKAMGRPKATFRIVEDLAGLIDEAAAQRTEASKLKFQAA